MNLKQTITRKIDKVQKINASVTSKYKQGLLDKLSKEIAKAKDKPKAVQDNAGLIARYKSAQPKPLTQMQQALLEATNG